MKLQTFALIPISAVLLLAQNQSPQNQNGAQNQNTTQNQNSTQAQNGASVWNGTLVDAACQTTRTQEITRQSNGERAVTTVQTVSCPVTPSTNTFGLLTPEGQFIRFDDPSNTRVLAIVRSNQALNKGTVRVVGTSQGGVAVVQSIDPAISNGGATAAGGAERVAPTTDLAFDVDHEGDKGKLIVTATGVQWENVNRADRSAKWTFAEIKEFRKDGQKQIELEPFQGKRYEFDVIGDRDTAYQAIADRIAAARPRQ